MHRCVRNFVTLCGVPCCATLCCIEVHCCGIALVCVMVLWCVDCRIVLCVVSCVVLT